MDQRLERVKKLISFVPNFPKPGIVFRDIFPVLREPGVFKDLVNLMTEHIKKDCGQVDVIVGLDARGFLFGPMIAQNLNVAFVPIRKKGKLPGEIIQAEYVLEYGSDTFEMQKDAISTGQRVVIVDDLLATGGTMSAACKLIDGVQATVVECIVIIELIPLNGRKNVPYKIHTIIEDND